MKLRFILPYYFIVVDVFSSILPADFYPKTTKSGDAKLTDAIQKIVNTWATHDVIIVVDVCIRVPNEWLIRSRMSRYPLIRLTYFKPETSFKFIWTNLIAVSREPCCSTSIVYWNRTKTRSIQWRVYSMWSSWKTTKNNRAKGVSQKRWKLNADICLSLEHYYYEFFATDLRWECFWLVYQSVSEFNGVASEAVQMEFRIKYIWQAVRSVVRRVSRENERYD